MTDAFAAQVVIGRQATVVHRAARAVALPRLDGEHAAATLPAPDGVLAVMSVFALDVMGDTARPTWASFAVPGRARRRRDALTAARSRAAT